jgi:hypothetical protein
MRWVGEVGNEMNKELEAENLKTYGDQTTD